MYSSSEKKPSEKDTFEKAPKKVNVKIKPNPNEEEATESKIKESGLRKSLNITDNSYKLTKPVLNKLLQNEINKIFMFRDKKIKMTTKLKKQLQLAVNMTK